MEPGGVSLVEEPCYGRLECIIVFNEFRLNVVPSISTNVSHELLVLSLCYEIRGLCPQCAK